MTSMLLKKLKGYGELTDQDKLIIENIPGLTTTTKPHTVLVMEGESPQDVRIIISGFACRYKILNNGKKHIVAYLIPGDFCDLHAFILDYMDHSIGTITECRILNVHRNVLLEIIEKNPTIGRALLWSSLVDLATLREWLVNMGQRSADRRIGHLLVELFVRLDAVGLVKENSFFLPFTQEEMANTMGLSNVHMNRVMKSLERRKFLYIKKRIITIYDLGNLKKFSGFNNNYLHIIAGTPPKI